MVGHRRVGALLVPDLRGDLGSDDRRGFSIPVLQDLDEVSPPLIFQGPDKKVVEHGDVKPGQAGEAAA
jgi:hypothetical protein